MQNIWSENKKVNTIINVLLFLMATNFFHYGQILLPIICLILFIDNKHKFKVNDIKTFVILCLFGITFLAFSYKLGAYSFIGLFLPVAYYIGSNIKEVNENNIKYIIYLLALGMGVHVVLNFATDLFRRGIYCFRRNSHLDFWTQDEYPTTQTSIFYDFIIGIIYYVLIYEKNSKLRKLITTIFAIMVIYEFALGRRTPILILAIVIYITMLIDYFILKNKNRLMKLIIIVSIICLVISLILYLIVKFDIFGLSYYLHRVSIIRKFIYFGFDSGRLDIFGQALKLIPSHLFGGKEISTIIGWDIHDLWFDTLDYAGIVPFTILVIHSIISTFVFVRFYKNKSISKIFKLLITDLYVVIIFQMFIEPIMTGASIFLLCSIVAYALIEQLVSAEKIRR